MATLIQSKQIQGIVTASVIEGDFKVASGSVDLTTAAGVTGSFSGSFVGDGTGLTINYSQLQGKPTIIGGIGIDVNQVGDTITITNTGGSGGDSLTSAALNSISDLNAYTASNDIIISGLNQATASLQSQIDNISVDTSSLAKLDSSNIFSGTQYFSGSLIPESSNTDDGIHSLGSATNPWKEIFISTASLNFVESEGVVRKLSLSDLLTLDSYPHEYSGLISSSQQISDLGFITSSQTVDLTQVNQFTQSIDSRVTALENATDLTGSDSQTLSVNGNQITISGGNTITIPTGSSGNHTDITSLNQFTSSFSSSVASDIDTLNQALTQRIDGVEQTQISRIDSLETFTQSIDARVSALESQPDLTGSDSQTLSIIGDQLTIAGGNTITIPTGSSGTSDFTQLTNVPSGLVSSSIQVLGGSGVLSGSHTDISALNQFTASYATDSASFDSRLSGIIETGSVIAPFAFGFVNNTTNGSGTGISWGNWNSSNSTLDFTFSTAQPDTNYAVITDSETFDDYFVGISNKTTTGFRAEFYDNSQSRTPSSFAPFNFIVYGSNPTQSVRVNVTSPDVTLLNTFTGSADSRLSSLETTTASLQSQIDALISATASYSTTDLTGSDSQTLSVVGDQLTISGGNTITIPTGSNVTLPSGLISSSQQITDLGFIDSAHTDVTQLNQFTQSIQSQVDSLTSATSSYLTSLPSGLVSGSVLRTLDGTNVISSSQQLIDLGFSTTDLTGSDSQTLSIVGDQLTITGGNTITIPTGSDLPSGLITSSQQISDLGYVTSALEAPFDGDRVVSNTLLGDLYTGGYNAGTSGSLAQFIEQVFFPTQAPTATFTNQTSKFNTNLATDGTNLVSVSLTDTVDNSPYTLVLSGTNASSLTAVPTNSESSSWEIRANGDLTAGTYSYDVTVGDSTNAERTYSGRSITIAQASSGTLTTNGTLYIIESATSGVITLSSTGRPGSAGVVSVSYSPNYGSQSATNFTSSNPLISVNSSNGQLSVGSPISGSGNLAGSTITSTITYEDQYGNQGSGNISVNVTQNNAPSIIETNNTSNLNTNLAVSGALLCTISFNDLEGDSIDYNSFTFQDASNKLVATRDGSVYRVRPNTNLEAATYAFVSSIKDIHGFNTTTEIHSFTVSAVDNGTLTGDSSIYIIESAVSGDSFRDATGYNNGNLANISVSYSPNYGSQVATLSSSNPAIVVDGSGNLTLGVDLSGSVTQSGDSFTSLISWTDQYGNTDSSTITATVFGNQSPSVTFTDNGLSDVTAVNGANIGSLSITDTESNSPFQVTIGGTDGSKFNLVPQNAASSSWEVQPNQSLTIGTYSVQFTVVDSYGEQSILNETISVTADADYGKVYVYTSTRTGGGTLSAGNYLPIMGASAVDSSTPPLVTTYTADTTSPFYRIKSGDLGNSTITVGGGQMNLRSEVSGSDLNTIISSSFSAGGTTEQILVIFPSGSDMVGTPTSMTDATGGSTNGEYVMFVKGGADTSFGSETSTIHGIQLDTAHEGYSTWYVVGRTGTNADNSYEVQIIPSSGSAPA